MNENDEKFDWRDLATQAPGKAGADEWGDGAQERSAWNKAMGWIILVSMTIAGVLIIWASSCNGFLCELLPVLLLMIDIFATIIILVIGSVINHAIKTTKGSVLDNENRTDNDEQENSSAANELNEWWVFWGG